MHTRITDILMKTGRCSLRIAVVRVTPSGEADSHRCCALFNPRAQGRRACPDPAVLPDAGRRGLPLQSAPEPRADSAGRGAGGARGAGAGHRSAGGGAEVQSSLRSGFCSRIYIYLFFFFLFSSTLVMGIFGLCRTRRHTPIFVDVCCVTRATLAESITSWMQVSAQWRESLLSVCLFTANKFEVNRSAALLRGSHVKPCLHAGGDKSKTINAPRHAGCDSSAVLQEPWRVRHLLKWRLIKKPHLATLVYFFVCLL